MIRPIYLTSLSILELDEIKDLKSTASDIKLISGWWTCQLRNDSKYAVFFEFGEAVYACSESRKQRVIDNLENGGELPILWRDTFVAQVVIEVNRRFHNNDCIFNRKARAC
ncbi:hypothetical protein D5018_19455 [Parashewanella curva]|uniref:Uncharacterized protein n=1 Tax=Parashewanella curva TaxID=2338552 RepID=A0A3L8PRL9_9GAMM|nr:hypothetical protein [Parashewanella curva]RLV58026.1 hypothetical protein D5018_19455 [Parashewanella curva]